jgi:hypothetical protein
MNKAFVKEPEQSATAHCPRCGSLGLLVNEETLRAQLSPESQAAISVPAFFCSFPTCSVAYFDTFERSVPADALVRPAYPKDPEAPLCACFGLTRDDIEADLEEGGVRRTRAVIDQAKSPAANCTVMAASGRSCIADVQRYFLKRKAEVGK